MIQNVTSSSFAMHGDGLSNFIQSLNGRSELVCGCYIRRRIVYKVTVGQRTHCSEKKLVSEESDYIEEWSALKQLATAKILALPYL